MINYAVCLVVGLPGAKTITVADQYPRRRTLHPI